MSNTDIILALNGRIDTAIADSSTALQEGTFYDSTSPDASGVGFGGAINTGQKWIDGKDIFRVVINITDDISGLTGDSTGLAARLKMMETSDVWPDSSNLESVVDYRVIIGSPGLFTDASYLNMTSALNQDFGFACLFTGTQIMIMVGQNGPNIAGAAGHVIIEYTRTV